VGRPADLADGTFDCVDEPQRNFCSGLGEVVVSGSGDVDRSALE
jgi:hypothetical protein